MTLKCDEYMYSKPFHEGGVTLSEKPPYYMLWLLGIFIVITLIVIIVAMGLKASSIDQLAFLR